MRVSASLSVVLFVGVSILTTGSANAFPTPPVLIDSGVSFARSDRDQRFPSAAFDGTNWLVVWEDTRGDREAVWAARFSSAGVLIDSGGICVADDEDSRTGPEVAFNGTNFLVVWEDGRNHSYDIYGARVTPAGAVLDPDGIMISRSNETDEYPAVASNGSEFLVVWEDDRSPGTDRDIYAARVSGSGQVLDTVNIAVATGADRQEYAAVASYSGGYMVAWNDWRNRATTDGDVYACRVSTAGAVLDPSGIAVARAAEAQEYPMLVSGGANCLIVWGDDRNGSGDVYGARVSGAGAVLDPSGLPIHPSPNYWAGDPTVAFTGTDYLVVWEDDSMSGGTICNLLASRVTTAGAVLDPTGVPVTQSAGNEYWPVVCKGGSNLLVAWQDYRDVDPDIYAVRAGANGAPLDTAGAMLSRVLFIYEQFTPAAAFDGANFLTVYADTRDPNGYSRLYGARFSQSGALLDPGGFRVGADFITANAPGLAFGGSNHLLTWVTGGGSPRVTATRLTPAGVVLDSSTIYTRISGQDVQPTSVASDGTNWFLVAAFRDYGGLANVQGIRISSSGVAMDSQALRLAYQSRGLEAAAVAFGANSYLVAWQDFRSNTTYDIYGAIVGTDGTIIDSGIPISTAATSQYSPSVAFDGTNWLVAWQDNRNGGERECFGTRVSQSGTVLDPAGIRLGPCPDNYDDAIQLVFDGANYFAVWQWRNWSNGDLWGARISPAGVVIDSFTVCTAPEYQATPAIAVGTGGKVFVSYSGWVASLHGYIAEKMRTWVGIYPLIGVEEGISVPPASRTTAGATIVRANLRLAPGTNAGWLLDAAGRSATALAAGNNDVSRLAPGVYFVRSRADCRKVIVARY